MQQKYFSVYPHKIANKLHENINYDPFITNKEMHVVRLSYLQHVFLYAG